MFSTGAATVAEVSAAAASELTAGGASLGATRDIGVSAAAERLAGASAGFTASLGTFVTGG